MTPNQKKAVEVAQNIMTEAEIKYGINMENVDIRFDLKGQTAGQACRQCGNFFIRLNKVAIEDHFDEMAVRTIGHEIAHVVCMMKPELGHQHNRGWQRVDRALGGDGSRCHDMPLKHAHGSFTYVASCGTEVELSKIMHNKIQRGQVRRLKKSKGALEAHHWVNHPRFAGKEQEEPVAAPKGKDLIDVILSWNNFDQMVEVHKLIEGNHAKLVSAQDGIAILSNEKRMVQVDATGERRYVNLK